MSGILLIICSTKENRGWRPKTFHAVRRVVRISESLEFDTRKAKRLLGRSRELSVRSSTLHVVLGLKALAFPSPLHSTMSSIRPSTFSCVARSREPDKRKVFVTKSLLVSVNLLFLNVQFVRTSVSRPSQ